MEGRSLTKVLFLVIFLLSPFPTWAVTRDAQSQGQGNTTPLTFSHTVTSSGGNRALFVGCVTRSITVTLSATYNGVSMSSVRSDAFVSGTALSTFMFKLVNPSTGSNTVSVAMSGGTANTVCGSLSATDVDQVTVTTDNKGACVASGTSASQTLTTTANDLLYDIMGLSSISQSLAQGTGQTDEIVPNPLEQTNTTGGASSQVGSIDGVMSWSWTTSGGNCQSAISIAHSPFSSALFGPLRRR